MKNPKLMYEQKVELIKCPACFGEIKFRRAPFRGQKFDCSNCFTELEVVNIHPLQFEEIDMVDYYEYGGYDDNDHADYSKDWR
ncbi:MAG: hypothetical protein AB8G95_27005 [Anaerolineae bacterium]